MSGLTPPLSPMRLPVRSTLLPVLSILLPAVAAALLAVAVLTGATAGLDRAVMRAVHGATWSGWEAWAFAFTFLGGRVGAIATTAALAGLLLLRRRPADAAGLVLCLIGGMVLTVAFKSAFAVPRPAELPAMIGALGSSFPSGHSLVAVCVYGYPAALLAGARGAVRWAALPLLAVPLAVMWSRLFLGVHWLSDVLAGGLLGAAWVAYCLRWRSSLSLGRAAGGEAGRGNSPM